MRNYVVRALLASVAVGLVVVSAEAAPILANSTSITSGGLRYEGLGENPAGSGRGTGNYTLGDGNCLFGGVNTTCTVTGTYIETAGSVDPGATGSFEIRMIYPGTGGSPIVARSVDPGGDALNLFQLNGGFFELDLIPNVGPPLSGRFPDVPFEDSFGFNAFLGTPTCTGNPTQCSIGQVGLEPGTAIFGGIQSLNIVLPQADPAQVPEPATLLLLGTGVAALVARRSRR